MKTSNFKLQTSDSRGDFLPLLWRREGCLFSEKLGAWNFPEVWSLKFEVFDTGRRQ
jgi:hypothetical protein